MMNVAAIIVARDVYTRGRPSVRASPQWGDWLHSSRSGTLAAWTLCPGGVLRFNRRGFELCGVWGVVARRRTRP